MLVRDRMIQSSAWRGHSRVIRKEYQSGTLAGEPLPTASPKRPAEQPIFSPATKAESGTTST
jgi:hypothetical protein